MVSSKVYRAVPVVPTGPTERESVSSQACQAKRVKSLGGFGSAGLLAPAHAILVRRLHKRRRNSNDETCPLPILRLLMPPPGANPATEHLTRPSSHKPNSRQSPHDVSPRPAVSRHRLEKLQDV